MSTFIYTRPSEELVATGSISVNTGTEDGAYPKENIADGHPEKPAGLTTNSGSWVVDLNTAQEVQIVGVFNHNFDAGLAVTLQGHATNTWGAPSFSQAFTVPARYLDLFTQNLWLDVKTLVPVAGNRTFRFWRLNISGVNTAPVKVGDWAMYSVQRNFGVRNIKKGSTRRLRRPNIVHETELLVRRTYDMGTTIREVKADLEPTDAILDDINALVRDAQGQSKAFMIVPYATTDTDPWLVTFLSPDIEWQRAHWNFNPITLEFGELSRGLYL